MVRFHEVGPALNVLPVAARASPVTVHMAALQGDGLPSWHSVAERSSLAALPVRSLTLTDVSELGGTECAAGGLMTRRLMGGSIWICT
jgi:hypothetical protein